MKKVAFYTLGCKVNQYETEAITELFEKAGYEVVDFGDVADVYIINTCTVTGESARKSRQMIRRAKAINEDSVVVVAGCYAQTEAEEVAKIPGVNLVIGTKDRGRIVEYVQEIMDGRESINAVDNIMRERQFEELKVGNFKEHTRAFVKIQDGCTQFCSYCIIPYARGPVRSRAPGDIVEEIQKIAEKGFKEVVLTGIHIASYGKDLGNISLLDIVNKVHEIDGIERIRLGSLEPTVVTVDFVKNISGLKKLCPHYHISLQSGCDETLKRMNRKYTTSQYETAVNLLRENIDDVAITTDVMVGFPGETEEEFRQTYEFLKKIEFMRMHVFKFSPRKGTPAYSFKNQVTAKEKEKRSKMVIALSMENTIKFNKRFIGRVAPVLFEQEVPSMPGYYEGLTPNYIRVLCKGDNRLKGEIRLVSMNETREDFVLGEII
ncbi:MAG TPA: tRNA (N(6)-L-threonylcarbamoyladenosine(37)-C(2))-methylthiotransferase MtaB [Clostridiaceae bacterium]|nr:tRNA (N(6)-L-threonylcarbamoyladenosine(37)-C(2))-methylthiotransferase MtaB [Clostridiaceae bacterium]